MILNILILMKIRLYFLKFIIKIFFLKFIEFIIVIIYNIDKIPPIKLKIDFKWEW
jgi:hypothetical protein